MKWRECPVTNQNGNGPVSRSSHGVSIIGDTLYLWGGEHVARTPVDTNIWALDLSEEGSMEWRNVSCQGEPPSPRFGHSQCAMGGNVYVFGGRAGTAIDEQLMDDLHKWDPQTATWSVVPTRGGSAPCPRSYHSMVAPPASTCFYVFGGCSQQGRLADLHRFDTETGVWTQLHTGPMEGRGGTPVVATSTGHIYIVGGFAGREMADVHAYSLQTNTWTRCEQLEVACSVAVAGCVEGVLAVVGGELEPSARGHAGAGSFSNRAITLTELEGQVKMEGTGPGPSPGRGWSAGDVWRGNKMVVVGGLTGDDANPVRLIDVWIGGL